MNLDVTTLNLIFIGTPGIVCYFLTSKLLGRVGRGNFEMFLLIFVYAMGAYAIYIGAARALAEVGISNLAGQLVLASPETMTIRTIDVGGASVASVLLAYAMAYGYRFNVVNRLGQRIKATNRAGDEDVWHFLHNSSREAWSSEWLVVRDHKVALQYFGAVSHWSESGEDRELLLTQVSVFLNVDGTKLYECDHLYICRNKDDLTIEIHAGGRGGGTT